MNSPLVMIVFFGYIGENSRNSRFRLMLLLLLSLECLMNGEMCFEVGLNSLLKGRLIKLDRISSNQSLSYNTTLTKPIDRNPTASV
jgi:hypothetical protein